MVGKEAEKLFVKLNIQMDQSQFDFIWVLIVAGIAVGRAHSEKAARKFS